MRQQRDKNTLSTIPSYNSAYRRNERELDEFLHRINRPSHTDILSGIAIDYETV